MFLNDSYLYFRLIDNEFLCALILVVSFYFSPATLFFYLAGNILDSMLLKASNKEAAGGGKETGGSAAPVPSAQRLLWCHCYHYCPEDSTNNTCR